MSPDSVSLGLQAPAPNFTAAYPYETVTINGVVYPVYGDLPTATAYLQANMSTPSNEWLATDAVSQARSLVAAVRWLDAQSWVSVPTDMVTPQALQWPRLAATDQFGNAIASTNIPLQLQEAEFELAAALIDNPDLRAQLQDPKPKELHAGTASITYFRPPGAALGGTDVQVLTPFPQNVMDLIGIWLSTFANAKLPIFVKGVHDKNEVVDDWPGVIHGF